MIIHVLPSQSCSSFSSPTITFGYPKNVKLQITPL